MNNEQIDFLTGLRSLLVYHDTIGIRHYPLGKDTKAFLRTLPQGQGQEVIAGKEKLDPPHTLLGGNTTTANNISVKLVNVAGEVARCQACELHKNRFYSIAGRGPEKARLMIIGDLLVADEQEQPPSDCLFGVEQDQMIVRMLAAINLPVKDVFMTNVIKCAIPTNCQPHASHVRICASFLHRQITALRPEIICTMGMIAARAVLRQHQPLSKLRGQFHEYEADKYMKIPVLTTYHPTYLLQNPEMKQATWTDLRLLTQRLGINLVG